MTRNRSRKLEARAAAAASDDRYGRALRRQVLEAPGASIRSYKGEIRICATCGQPAYDSTTGPHHFTEQEGAVFCPAFPAAARLLRMDWHEFSLALVKERYPDTEDTHFRRRSRPHKDQFQQFTGRVAVCAHCGQPAFYDDEVGMRHFTNQWDGIICPHFPLAGEDLAINWHPRSLADWKAAYRCSYPH